MEPHKDRCLIYGCMALGGGWNKNPLTADDERTAQAAIEAAMEIGIDTFDHADIYAFTKAEEVFGRVLKRSPGLRERMIVQSKAGIQLEHGPKNSSTYNFSRGHLLETVARSVERLGAGYLDVLLLHRPDALMDAEEVAGVFGELRAQGLVRSFGVSNMSIHQIGLLHKYWPEPLIANQLQLSLGHPLMLDMGVSLNTRRIPYDSGMQGMIEYCQLHEMAIQAWSPLDRGKYMEESPGARSGNDQEAWELVGEFARRHDTTRSSLALAWLFMVPGVIQPIIGSSRPERIRACKDALSVRLTRDEWYQLWITARGENIP